MMFSTGHIHCQSETLPGRSYRPIGQGKIEVGHGVPWPAGERRRVHESAVDRLRGISGRAVCGPTGRGADPLQQCPVRGGGARRRASEIGAVVVPNGGMRANK